jgi:PhnB protein
MSQPEPRSVMPIINVASIEDLHRFYTEKLGFQHLMGVIGKDGQLDFVTVVLDGARIMFSRAQERMEGLEPSATRRPQEIYLEVADVQAYHHQVKLQGVKVTTPLTTQWWGDRTFTVLDPHGYQLWFYQTVAEPKPPQGTKLV